MIIAIYYFQGVSGEEMAIGIVRKNCTILNVQIIYYVEPTNKTLIQETTEFYRH